MIGCFYTNSDFQGFFEKGDIMRVTQGLTGRLVLMWDGKVIDFGAGLSLGVETEFNILKDGNKIIRGGQLNLSPRDLGQIKSSGKYAGLNHSFAHLVLYDASRLESRQKEEYDILRQMLGFVDGRPI